MLYHTIYQFDSETTIPPEDSTFSERSIIPTIPMAVFLFYFFILPSEILRLDCLAKSRIKETKHMHLVIKSSYAS